MQDQQVAMLSLRTQPRCCLFEISSKKCDEKWEAYDLRFFVRVFASKQQPFKSIQLFVCVISLIVIIYWCNVPLLFVNIKKKKTKLHEIQERPKGNARPWVNRLERRHSYSVSVCLEGKSCSFPNRNHCNWGNYTAQITMQLVLLQTTKATFCLPSLHLPAELTKRNSLLIIVINLLCNSIQYNMHINPNITKIVK